MRILRSLTAGLLAAALVTGIGGVAPASAKASKPAAAKKETKAEVKTVSCEITAWSGSDFALKVGAVSWKFSYDKAHFAQIGKAAVGAKGTVKYTKDGGKNVASSIKISK